MNSRKQTPDVLLIALLVVGVTACGSVNLTDTEKCTVLSNVTTYVKTTASGKTVYKVKQSFARDQLCYDFGVKHNDSQSEDFCKTNMLTSENYELCGVGMAGSKSINTSVFGKLIHIYTDKGGLLQTMGCQKELHNFTEPFPKDEPWIALVERGECRFNVKISNILAHHTGAVGLIVYNEENKQLQPMNHDDHGIVTVMIDRLQGIGLRQYMMVYDDLYMNITQIPVPPMCLPNTDGDGEDPPSQISVMIVAISFVVMMVISLAWLVFYYIQRHRNMMKTTRHNEKLERAMRKALRRIGETNIERDEQMTRSLAADVCSYCLEGFEIGQVLRNLPCGHNFHKLCVDQWLIKNRVCPNCKVNVLISLGVKVRGIPDLEEAEADLNTTELAQLNLDGTTAENNDPILASSQLLTDGQNMYLYVPNDVNNRLEPGEEVHLQIDSEPIPSEQSENPGSTLLSHSQASVTSQHTSQHDVAV